MKPVVREAQEMGITIHVYICRRNITSFADVKNFTKVDYNEKLSYIDLNC